MVDLGEVVLAAVKSVAAALCVLAAGAVLARKQILDQELLGRLSQLTKFILLPCLIFNSVAGGMSPEFVAANWRLSIAGIMVFGNGFCFASCVVRFVRIAPDLKPWFVLAVAMPNTIALPLVLIEALCHEESPSQGGASQCFNSATTRLFTITLLDNLVFWSLGPFYIRRQARLRASTALPTSPKDVTRERAGTVVGYTAVPAEGGDTVIDVPAPAAAVAHVDSGPPQPPAETIGAPSGGETAVQLGGEPATPSKVKGADGPPLCGFLRKLRSGLFRNPPVLANVAALLVALAPPVHDLLYAPGAPASFLASAISFVGKASPPITSMIAGGSLGLQVQRMLSPSPEQWKEDPLGLRALGVSRAAVVLMLLSRIVVVPTINLSLLLLAMGKLPPDRWARLILFFQPAGPTANVVTLLAQVSGEPRGAQLVATSSIGQMLVYIPMSMVFIGLGITWTKDLA